MSDITKIREWEEVEGHELEDPEHPEWGWRWPAPPKCIESRLSGPARAQVLANLGRAEGDPADVRLIEREVESGYSEFTVEMEFEIEVWVHEDRQAQKVWDCDWGSSANSALAKFMEWVAPAADVDRAGVVDGGGEVARG